MSLDPISSGLDVINTILGMIPNKNLEQQAQLKIQLQQLIDQAAVEQAQAEINKVEAGSESLFVSGARPAIMWICAIAFFWQFVTLPILLFINAEFHYVVTVPDFNTSAMITVLMGMLGLGTMRSVDKAIYNKSNKGS